MSKTRARIYSEGFRAGRRLTRWGRFKWLVLHKRSVVEDWLTDDDASDMDFLVVVLAVVAVGMACVVMAFLARG